jgi:hypothetical protein
MVATRTLAGPIVLAVAVSLSGRCATGRPATAGTGGTVAPGTGDISFKLVWTGSVDLDLLVTDPFNEEISFSHRTSSSGGILDVDCNATPEQMCSPPIENVFWPRGTASAGRYSYRVRIINQHDSVFPVTFTVLVLHGSTVLRREVGSFAAVPSQFSNRFWGPGEISWTR